jgi:hypothetical protein
VARIRRGQPKSLPSVDTSLFAGSGSSGGGQPGGAPGSAEGQ